MKIPPPGSPRASFRSPKPAPRHRTASAPPPVPATPFHAFIAYADVPAAGRAMSTIADVLSRTRGKHTLHPMLWRFNQIMDPKWRDAAIADAALANVVVLASTSAHTLTPQLEAWVGQFLAHSRGRRTTLVALFGSEDAWTITIEEPRFPSAACDPTLTQQMVA